MGNLEEVLGKVETLGADLSASKIIESGEIEPVYEEVLDSAWSSTGRTNEIVGYSKGPPKNEPDTEKRDAARKELQQIYDSSEWYSARYKAGIVLGLGSQLNLYLNELEKKVNATKTVMKCTDEGDYKEVYQEGKGYYSGSSNEWVPNNVEKPFDEPDEETRIKAVEDSSMLFKLSNFSPAKELIEKAYNKNELESVRHSAGKKIGYSSFRIWLHEKMR